MKQAVRIATRKSPLALWQAHFVKTQLQSKYPDIAVELLGLLTTADKMQTIPLNKIGGKGLFVKELEKALLENKADIAVHSIKDMPAQLPEGLELTTICKREDPRDAFVCDNYASLFELPVGAIVGTSSLRRKAQVLALRPDLNVLPLRGNVGSRINKLDQKEFDALILAVAGLKRLKMESRIKSFFSCDQIMPAAGQGAIGIECRSKDTFVHNLISFLDDLETRHTVLAERVLSNELGGSCQFPIAAYAIIENHKLFLRGLVADPKGDCILKTQKIGLKEHAVQIGLEAAADLKAQGALELLKKVMAENLNNPPTNSRDGF